MFATNVENNIKKLHTSQTYLFLPYVLNLNLILNHLIQKMVLSEIVCQQLHNLYL